MWEQMKCMSFDTDEKATSLVLRPNNKLMLLSLSSYLNLRKERGEFSFYVWFGDG